MEIDNLYPHLVAVLFPGIVKNENKAIDCLGGIRNISQVYSQSKKRLGLSFQPENPYVRKIYGDPKTTAGLLLKVRVKKSNDNDRKEVISTSIIGRVNKIYTYDSLCDFQYLPVQREESTEGGAVAGPLKCILDTIMPSGVDNIDFLSKPSPLFIVPATFTRLDKSTIYSYTERKYQSKIAQDAEVDNNDDYHQKKRAERGIPINRFVFNLTDEIPSGPNEYFLEQKRLKISVNPDMEGEYQAIVALYEKQPVWSTNMIKYHTKLKTISLKLFLPCVAFFMKDGPWRGSWVKYGYDPRKEPEARKYQTLDFRVRHAEGIHSMVKRESIIPLHKRGDSIRNTTRRAPGNNASFNGDELTESHVYFKPDVPPPRRQIFYQLCDVKLPEVEKMLSSEPPPGYMCHEKHGWLPPNAGDTIREHMFHCVKESVISNHLRIDQDCSDEEIFSDDDTSNIFISENSVQDNLE